MEVLLPRSRGKRKPERSQSLPGRLNFAPPSDLRGRIEGAPHVVNPKSESTTQTNPGETSPTQKVTGEDKYSQPLSFDDWSHLQPDERGAELAREARVWKVYVGETDKWDKELIEGWDKSMDVLLVFAALFSAISSAFLIESSGMLKQDPNDVSAEALVLISQALVAIANSNSSATPPAMLLPEQSDFIPSNVAVIVNTLWYLSLSLSIATAFLAMLAKDWCYSFSAHRTGHPRDQAHRRQRRWKLIERWKMEELVLLLPSLMHLSLLLFAIGLCLYLWDLNHTTAIPVMCVASAFLLFYIWSSVTASIVMDFPYTTIISRILRSKYMKVLYSGVTIFGYFLLVILFFVIGAAVILYFVLAMIVLMVVTGVYYLFLLFDQRFLKRFAKKPDDVGELCESAWDGGLDFAMIVLDSPFQLCSIIHSGFTHVTKKLELTEDLTTSLALGWLIQHCETPSAVDIALQAIAGAGQSIPREPLLLCQATEQIMRRIVSHSTDDKRSPTNSLYTRGLMFLDKSGLDSIGESQRIRGDIEVMVWDLKSKNERNMASLIKDGSFIPSEDNLEAMRIGNSAASRGLRFLTGEVADSTKGLYSISELLSRHFELGGKKLHPAALQSLANAAALQMSLSMNPELPLDLVGLCMGCCAALIGEQPDSENTESTCNFGTGVVFILCVLLHGCSSSDKGSTKSISQLRTRDAIRTLIEVSTKDGSFRENLFWVGCSELISNPSRYGLDTDADYWEPLETWCSEHTSTFMQEWGTPFLPSWHGNYKPSKIMRKDFLTAITRVYELVLMPQSCESSSARLPELIHTTLAIVACGNTLDSEQSQMCNELVLKFGFPTLSTRLTASLALNVTIDQGSQTVLAAMGASYNRRSQPPGRRHFAATQLWLLFHLASESSPGSGDEPNLREAIQRELEQSMQMENKGFDEAKKVLEQFIIEGYQKDRNLNGEVANNEDTALSFWDKLKARIPVWQMGESQRSLLRLGTRLNRLANALQAEGEDSPEGQHQRTYAARIIEQILLARGTRGDENLLDLIEEDLGREVPQLRDLPLWSPPSMAEPIASPLTEPKSGLVELYAHGTEYISLDVHNKSDSDSSDVGDNYSDYGSEAPFKELPKEE